MHCFRLVILLIYFQTIQFTASSQKTNIGKEMSYDSQFDNFIGTDSSGFYTLCYGKKGVGMQIYINKYSSQTFEMLFTQKIESEEVQKALNFKPGANFTLVAQTFLIDNFVYVFFEV